MPMISVAEYNQIEQLRPLESLWNRLHERTPGASFQHSWDCFAAGAVSEGMKLRILVALIAGRPFGILPLQVETRSTPQGTLRVLSGLGEPVCDFAGPLGPNTTAMLAASFRHLQRTRRDWDTMEFRVANSGEMLAQRLQNAFRLMGWRADCESSGDWREVCPEAVMSGNLPGGELRPDPRLVFERFRPEDNSFAPWPMLAVCLSLVEETQGSEKAKRLRGLHQAAFRAGVSDWCLLSEAGVPQAAALNLITREGIKATVLTGRTDALKHRLVHRLLEDALWRGDGPYWFRSSEVPFFEGWKHATGRGFRYTHISPWAFRARWMRLRERIQSVGKNSPQVPETNICPRPHKLMLHSPSFSEAKSPVKVSSQS